MLYIALAACILYVQHGMLQQAAQAKQATQKLQRQAIRDGLTGLFNHTFIDGLIGDAINRARRSNTPVSLLMIDVDNFKPINDNLGHNAGDEALKELVKVLGTNKRSTDYLGRWGGDELIMLLTDTDLAGASHLAEKLRSLVDTHSFQHGMHITISLGASQYQDGDTPISFIERADAAMYRAKRSGRNRAEIQSTTVSSQR
jgi:diguanylate cyclase (GGDEF)-like protein